SNVTFQIEPSDGIDFGSMQQATVSGDWSAPTSSSEATNFTSINAGQNGLFNITWRDNVGLSGFIFSINDSGAFVNNSFVRFSGTTNVSSVAHTINITVRNGTIIGVMVYANDTSNNWNVTEIFTFSIMDLESTWSSNATNFTFISEGDNGLFNVTWTDDVGLSGFIFGINDSGQFVNNSFVRFSGTPNVSSVAHTVNITAMNGVVIGWRVYANDTGNNWNVTNIFTFSITGQEPAWSNNVTNFTTITVGEVGIFNVTWTDNIGLSGFIFSSNDSGGFVNQSFVRFSGTTNVSSVAYTIASSAFGTVGWRVYANDTSNNWNATAIFTFGIADNTPPFWFNNVTNFTGVKQNDTVLFNTTWSDDTGLSGFIFSINDTGVFVNSTFQRFSGTTNHSINITRINSTHGTRLAWRFYANDTSNNWNTTPAFTLFVNVPPTGSVPAQTFRARESLTIDLNDYFSDEDVDHLMYTVTTTGGVTASLSGSVVTFTAGGVATDIATITVTDTYSTISRQTDITVTAAPEPTPAPSGFSGGGEKAAPAPTAPTAEAAPAAPSAPAVVTAPEAQPVTQAQPVPVITRISVSGTGAPGGFFNISKYVRLQQLPVNASNFTKFQSIIGVEPIANFTEMTIELGYVCAGPRFNVYKCVNWNFTEGRCNNDTEWTVYKQLEKGLLYVNITLRPHDPGLGIGPSPYAPYCGDNTCDEGETCSNCAFDCGQCKEAPAVTITKKKGWFETLTGGFTGYAAACTEQWVCEEWGAYNETGYRSRMCTDMAKCTPPKVETELCEYMEKEEAPLFEVKPVVVERKPVVIALYSLLLLVLLAAVAVSSYLLYTKQQAKKPVPATAAAIVKGVLAGEHKETILRETGMSHDAFEKQYELVQQHINQAKAFIAHALAEGKKPVDIMAALIKNGWPEVFVHQQMAEHALTQLDAFIQDATRKGYSPEDIKQALQKKGWPKASYAHLQHYAGAQEAVVNAVGEAIRRGYSPAQIATSFSNVGWDASYITRLATQSHEKAIASLQNLIWGLSRKDALDKYKQYASSLIDEALHSVHRIKERWLQEITAALLRGVGQTVAMKMLVAQGVPDDTAMKIVDEAARAAQAARENVKSELARGKPLQVVERELAWPDEVKETIMEPYKPDKLTGLYEQIWQQVIAGEVDDNIQQAFRDAPQKAVTRMVHEVRDTKDRLVKEGVSALVQQMPKATLMKLFITQNVPEHVAETLYKECLATMRALQSRVRDEFLTGRMPPDIKDALHEWPTATIEVLLRPYVQQIEGVRHAIASYRKDGFEDNDIAQFLRTRGYDPRLIATMLKQ
ncbi:hypothetical protein HY639_04060, partial [Candidatus Woesearchaeota archaeon]|nr:hypothetical protein [Candidatus Woesearchaeota archaeon]